MYQPDPQDDPFEMPSRGISLQRFNDKLVDLFDDAEADESTYYHALHLALTGIDSRRRRQYSIEPTENYFSGDRDVNVVRDYDSVICFTSYIPITDALFLYPVANPVHALRTSLHTKVPMRIRLGEDPVEVHPCYVPNICLGEVGIRTRLRMFFPRLYEAETKSAKILTDEQLAAVYDDGIYPTICEITPDQATNWPVNYSCARIRARNRNGSMQYGTRPFPKDRVERFGYEVKRRLASKHAWAQSIVFMTQVQGIKEAHQHTPGDPFEAQDKLDLALAGLSSKVYADGVCFVDVGLELSEEGFAYQWRTDCHHRLVETFTSLTRQQAVSVTALGRSSYQRDYSAGLLHVSGCRVSLRRTLGRRDDAVYMQAYTTDKAIIEDLEGGKHGLTLDGKAVLDGTPPRYMDNFYQVYYDATSTDMSAARLEFRVPLSRAVDFMTDFPADLMEHAICAFPTCDWWQWRCLRLQAFSRTLTLQNQADPRLRYTTSALMLTAALVWLTNGLHSRPDDDRHGRDLMCSSLPLTADYNLGILQVRPPVDHPDDLPYLLTSPYGAFFLRDIEWPPVADCPRFKWSRNLHPTTFQHYLGHTAEDLWRHHNQVAYIPRDILPKQHTPTQEGMSRRHTVEITEPDEQVAHPIYLLRPHPRDIGEDLPASQRYEGLGDNKEILLPMALMHLWHQFLSDLLQKCGVLGKQPFAASHCHLTLDERLAVTEETYRDLNLASVFTRVQWKCASPEEWREAFNTFMPYPAHPGPGLSVQPQNFMQMRYYLQWTELKELVPRPLGVIMVVSLSSMFDKLGWVPRPYNDCPWMYRRDSQFTTLPASWKHEAPQILLHPRHRRPVWSTLVRPGPSPRMHPHQAVSVARQSSVGNAPPAQHAPAQQEAADDEPADV